MSKTIVYDTLVSIIFMVNSYIIGALFTLINIHYIILYTLVYSCLNFIFGFEIFTIYTFFQTIPDPSFIDDQVKMFGSWYGMNNICIFPTKTSEKQVYQKSSSDIKNDRNIIHLKHKTMLFDSKVRQLVNESSGVFQELQINVDDPNKSTDALYYSRKYR